MEYGQQGQHGHGTTGRVDQYGNPVGGVGHGTGTGTGGMGYGTTVVPPEPAAWASWGSTAAPAWVAASSSL